MMSFWLGDDQVGVVEDKITVRELGRTMMEETIIPDSKVAMTKRDVIQEV